VPLWTRYGHSDSVQFRGSLDKLLASDCTPCWRCDPTGARAVSFLRFLDHTQRRTAVGRTALDEWSARCKDLYLTTHNTHARQTSMSPRGIRTPNPSRRAAADPRLRPRSQWDRRFVHSKANSLLLCYWNTSKRVVTQNRRATLVR